MADADVVPGRDSGVDGLRKLNSFRNVSVWPIALGFISFLGAAHILIRTSRYDPLYASDAGIYTWYAEALATGRWENEQLREAMENWPPLFPVTLAFFRLFGVEPSIAGRYFNIACFGLTILLAGHWLHRFIRFRLITIGATITITVSYPLARVSSYVMTEPLLILITLLALIQIESYLSSKRTSNNRLLLSIIISALAPLTRWMGITVIITGALLILMHPGSPTRLRWRRAAFYSAMSSLPVALWMTRTWFAAGTLTGHRGGPEEYFGSGESFGSGQSLGDSLSQIGEYSSWWVFVRQDPGWLDICVGAAVVLIMLEIIRSLVPVHNPITLLRKADSSSDARERPALAFATFTIVYLVTLIIVAPFTTDDPLYTRFLAITFAPLAIAATFGLDRFLWATYRSSGISAYKNQDGWSIRYSKAFGPMAATKWILIGLILIIFMTTNIRNIVLYVDVLITYDAVKYHF